MVRKKKTIVQQHAQNSETLKCAFAEGNVALLDCVEKTTGEHVAVLTAMYFDGTEYHSTPFAKFFNGNPYEMLIPPGNPEYPAT